MANFLLILIGVLLNTAAQILLKKAMLIIGTIQINMTSILTMLPKICINLYVWSGMVCYVVSFLIWLVVLSRVEVSYAYPFLSIGYIFTAFIGYFFFGESMTLFKVTGIGVICLGVILLFQS